MINRGLHIRAFLAVVLIPIFLFIAFTIDSRAKGKGLVVSIRDGRLERLEKNVWRLMASQQEVSDGERLRTDKTAVAVIEFTGVGKFVIGPSSDLELGKDSRDFKAKMDRGAMWLKSDLPKGGKASITTSLATAGIRGTSFSVVFGEGEKIVCICTCSGSVETTARDGRRIIVPKGTYIPVPSGDPAPLRLQPSLPLLEKRGGVFDFCFNCHIAGGKGKLKPDSI